MSGENNRDGRRRGRSVKWTYTQLPAIGGRGGDPASVRTLEPQDLAVMYQPIVDLRSGEIFGHEALARCIRQEFLNPEDLFERAVEERYTGRLGRMLRKLAISQFDGRRLFLNIHPDELAMRWLVRPDDPVACCEVPLYIEITESATFEYFDLCMAVLKDVSSRADAYMVVDDFGSGYSNIKRIIELEPKVVKLDRGLISGIDLNPRQQRLVRDLVRMFEGLGALTVAEGIETEAELDAARDAGAQLGQGYFLGRPGLRASQRVSWPKVR